MGSPVVMPTVLGASSVSQATGGAVANYGWRSEADIVGLNVAAGWRSGRVGTTAISGSYAATIGWLQCHDLLNVKSSCESTSTLVGQAAGTFRQVGSLSADNAKLGPRIY
jgi:hypothetical protein